MGRSGDEEAPVVTRAEAVAFETMLSSLKGVRDALQRITPHTAEERTLKTRALARAEKAVGQAEAVRAGAFVQ